MNGFRELLLVLMGKEACPSITVITFSSVRMLLFLILYCVFESGLFLDFTQQLASFHVLTLPVLYVARTCVVLLMVTVWLLKSGVISQVSFHSVATPGVLPDVLFLQSAVLWLLTAMLSAQVTFDVFVMYPERVGLSPHALMTLTGLKQMAPFAFFIMRDTPIRALIPAWGVGILVSLANCLYSRDKEQLAFLAFYSVGSVIIFTDTLMQNKKMSDMIVKLQNTLKENEELAVEAQALELRAMIGNVAHDLKTPLTSFLSGIECMHDMVTEWTQALHDPDFKWTDECLAKCRAANKEMLQCLQNMSGANSFMTMTINRCLDYTKASKGFKLVPTFETVSLDLKLKMTTHMIRNAHPAIDISIRKTDEDICSHFITDRQWLIENLLCLLSNAAKYSHNGSVDIAVMLGTDARYLRFEVQDTGIGLSDEAMQNLFKPFKQAQRLAGGTGLGLFSLAKRVEALQGQYGVMRRPDGEQGSLFWFTIPYRPDEMSSNVHKQRLCSANVTLNPLMDSSSSSDSSASQHQAPVSSLEAPLAAEGPFHVLVVDDAPLIVKMTTMLLQRKGHTVQHAVNGADALEKLCVHVDTSNSPRLSHGRKTVESAVAPFVALPFDVVLMDLQMPVLDGIEAIRRLRAAEARRSSLSSEAESEMSRPGQFVIALSANSDDETKQEALGAGADAFMSKPFTYDAFSALLVDRKCL